MLYPLKFSPILMERVWGGDTLARYGKPIPRGKPIGESWEIVDRDEAQSIVANGAHKGQTLRQVINSLGYEAVVGRVPSRGAASGDAAYRFPLLIKLLDARDWLSLQVHPPPHVTPKLNGEAKTEMWYVLDADCDAQIYAGFRRGVTAAEFMRALQESPEKLEQFIHHFPALPGDAVFIPSGRVHAIGAGLVIAEIQQNSDTTYRVYDWGRKGRELHVEQSLASMNFQDYEPKKVVPVSTMTSAGGLWRLVECEYFVVEKLDVRNSWNDRCDGSTFHVLSCVAGELGILTPTGSEERLRVGEFALLPAALGMYSLAPLAENTSALRAFIPA